MSDSSVGRVALAVAWLGGGGLFVALALWGRPEVSAPSQFLRLGVA
jgi:hypothetical protein